jgi:hypothetical protein
VLFNVNFKYGLKTEMLKPDFFGSDKPVNSVLTNCFQLNRPNLRAFKPLISGMDNALN